MRTNKSGFHRKQMGVVHYVSDGTGRDSYVIKNYGGTCNEYRVGHVKYPEEYLREDKNYPYNTPMMDSR